MGALILAISCGVLAASVAVACRWRVRRWLRWTSALPLSVLGVLGLAVGGYWSWFTHRSPPEPTREEWFAGVRYEREVLRQPRPIVAHLVRVDLTEPGIDFRVTPSQPSAAGDLLADTTSSFAVRHGVQVAINANFFYPFHAHHPLDYAPHVGDPVHVVGPAASGGTLYGESNDEAVTLYLSRDRRLGFERPPGEVWQAISGLGYVVRDGAPVVHPAKGFNAVPYPRVVAAVDATGRYLLLLVIDGKQPGYSEGVTLAEVADLLLRYGGHTGIQLDGGGSTTLVRRDEDGRARWVNSPINFRLTFWERPVANHLGIYARPPQR
jgi:hypothetical protein